MKETKKSKKKAENCSCKENKSFINNLITELNKPSYKSHVLDEIQAKLKYNFKNRDLLKEAFFQPVEILALASSIRCDECREEIKSARLKSYESKEFLGNSFFKLATTTYLYKTYPQENEGMLSRLRSEIISNENLARVAIKKLGFREYLPDLYGDLKYTVTLKNILLVNLEDD